MKSSVWKGLLIPAAFALVAWPAVSLAQGDVFGQWEAVDEDGKKILLTLNPDGSGMAADEPIRFTRGQNGTLRITYVEDQQTLTFPFSLANDTLTITDGFDTYRYRKTTPRADEAPVAAPGMAGAAALLKDSLPAGSSGTEAAASPPSAANPPVAADQPGVYSRNPLEGRFRSETFTLALRPTEKGYSGTISVNNDEYSVEASGTPESLTGKFVRDGDTYNFTAAMAGDTLVFRTGGVEFRLLRDRLPPAPASPVGVAGPSGPASGAPGLGGAAPGTFRRVEEGFEIPLPGGFRPLRQEGSGWVLGSDVAPGVILVIPSPGLTESQIRQAAVRGFFEEGVALKPAGSPWGLAVGSSQGMGVAIRGQLSGTQVEGILAGLAGADGQGVVILAASTPDQWSRLKPFAEEVIRGVRLFPPLGGPLIQQWDERLRGQKLTWLSTQSSSDPTGYGGHTDRRIISLCADGTFRYEGRFSLSVGTAAVADLGDSPGVTTGRWRVAPAGGAAALLLTPANGSTQTFALADENGRTYLNGERYYVTPGDPCPY